MMSADNSNAFNPVLKDDFWHCPRDGSLLYYAVAGEDIPTLGPQRDATTEDGWICLQCGGFHRDARFDSGREASDVQD